MIKNILAVIGVLAIVAGGIALAVFKPWEKPDVVSVESSSPVVYFDALRDEGIFVERVRIEPGKKPRAVLYVSYSKFFKAPVILRAFDGNRNEIGRSRRVLSGDVEDADYADFEFGERVPLKSATFFELSKSKVESVPAEEIVPAQVSENAPESSTTPSADVPAPAAPEQPEAVPAK